MVPRRSPAQCNARWSQLQNLDDAVKTPWTEEEDTCMSDLVATYGPGRWAVISSCMPGRNGKQCRERWHNQLNPTIKKDAWTPEEDETIITLQAALGNAWAKIAEALDGRTDNAVKNRWHSSLTKPTVRRTKRAKRHAPASTSTASGGSSGTRSRLVRGSNRRTSASAKRRKCKPQPLSASDSVKNNVASPSGVDAAVDADICALSPAPAALCECVAPLEPSPVVQTDAFASDLSGLFALLVGRDDSDAAACALGRLDTRDAAASSANLSAPDGRLRSAIDDNDSDAAGDEETLATSALADCLLFAPSFALCEPPLGGHCALFDDSASLFASCALKVESDTFRNCYDVEADDALFASVWRGSGVSDAGCDAVAMITSMDGGGTGSSDIAWALGPTMSVDVAAAVSESGAKTVQL